MNEVRHYQQAGNKDILLTKLPLRANTKIIYIDLIPKSDDPEYIRKWGWNNEQLLKKMNIKIVERILLFITLYLNCYRS